MIPISLSRGEGERGLANTIFHHERGLFSVRGKGERPEAGDWGRPGDQSFLFLLFSGDARVEEGREKRGSSGEKGMSVTFLEHEGGEKKKKERGKSEEGAPSML